MFSVLFVRINNIDDDEDNPINTYTVEIFNTKVEADNYINSNLVNELEQFLCNNENIKPSLMQYFDENLKIKVEFKDNRKLLGDLRYNIPGYSNNLISYYHLKEHKINS